MKKALFLDDEPLVINGIKRILRPLSSSIDVRFFTSPVEAEDFINKESPEFCFTDYMMPGINGVDFILKMKKKSPGTDFYILSGDGKNPLFQKPEIKGMLQKPCSVESLKKILGGQGE